MAEYLKILMSMLQQMAQAFLGYLLGKEQARRQQLEEVVKLKQKYEELDEKNKDYHDRGKSGVLDRVRKRSHPRA